jgi:hypothetical protein
MISGDSFLSTIICIISVDWQGDDPAIIMDVLFLQRWLGK